MSAGDSLSPQQFWRAHPNDRPFSVEDAKSREWASDDEYDEGYSSFEKPERLFGYFHPGERDGFSSHVVSFSGRRVGTGMDGEPLVVPDMKHIRHHSWEDVASMVGHDRVADIERRNGWKT